MNGCIMVQDAAKKWSVTSRQVQLWCKKERILGAQKNSRIWVIPENAERPTTKRKVK